jgi:hypothetical protein
METDACRDFLQITFLILCIEYVICLCEKLTLGNE